MIGKDFESSRNALSPDNKDKLHLLEETSIDLQLSNSIVPSAYNLARFKVSGRLPKLQVNLSDMKYKALMRLIDVSIPKFGDDEEAAQVAAPPKNARPPPGGFPMSRVFSKDKSQEYHIEEEDKEEFFEADTGVPDVCVGAFDLLGVLKLVSRILPFISAPSSSISKSTSSRHHSPKLEMVEWRSSWEMFL